MTLASNMVAAAIRLGYRRALSPTPTKSRYQSRHSARRINALLPHSGLGKSYLEIGVERGLTFEAVVAELKVCVDPEPLFRPASLPEGSYLVTATSDKYFAESAESDHFDFIFLDGLHTAIATYSDLLGAIKLLSPGGTILIDDVLPTDEVSAHPSFQVSNSEKRKYGISHSRWYGDVWRVAWLVLRRYPEIEVTLIGAGGDDHTQAILKLPSGLSSIGADIEGDLTFMSELKFNEVVTESGLSKIAIPEGLVLSGLTG